MVTFDIFGMVNKIIIIFLAQFPQNVVYFTFFFFFIFLFLQFLSSASMMTLDMQALCLSFLIDVARSINDLAIYFDDVKKPPYCLLWQI